jgi:hypothetical protein
MWRLALSLIVLLGLSSMALAQERTPAPGGATLYIVSPTDGGSVSSPVTVVFGLKGMGVAPAGIEKENTGHHHLVIDADLPPLDEPVPSDEHYRHFGGGQTETTVELSPGKHTLQLILGDHNHIPHDPPVTSEKIAITVK